MVLSTLSARKKGQTFPPRKKKKKRAFSFPVYRCLRTDGRKVLASSDPAWKGQLLKDRECDPATFKVWPRDIFVVSIDRCGFKGDCFLWKDIAPFQKFRLRPQFTREMSMTSGNKPKDSVAIFLFRLKRVLPQNAHISLEEGTKMQISDTFCQERQMLEEGKERKKSFETSDSRW